MKPAVNLSLRRWALMLGGAALIAGGLVFGSVGLAGKKLKQRAANAPTATNPVTKIAFASDRDGNYEIYTMAADGSDLSRLTENSDEDREPAWSPDGTRLAFVSSRDGNPEIYVMNLDGSAQTRLTNNAAPDLSPTWLRDGSNRIAFVSSRTGNDDIFLMNPDGTGQTNITNDPYDDHSPSSSPDGTRIAFASNRDAVGTSEIYTMDRAGLNVVRLTNNDREDFNPNFSMGRITFQSDRADNEEVFTMNADGTGQVNLTNNAAVIDGEPSRSADGSRIAFATSRDNQLEIYAMNADGSGVTRLTNNFDDDIQPAFQPTGSLPPTPGANAAIVQFSAVTYSVNESGPTATITVNRSGVTTGVSSVDYATVNGTATDQRDYTPNFGTLNFAAGETSKTFTVSLVDDNYVEDAETMNVTLNKPVNASFGANTSAVLTIMDNDTATGVNPIDLAPNFVRQQYLDLLSREPDAAGFAFWVNQITSCNSDLACVAARRQAVSAAFFIEQEFQQSGFFVYRLYQASLSRQPRYREFIQDRPRIVASNLAGSQAALADDFVMRDEFMARYPAGLTNTEFVNRLFDAAGLTPFTAERQAQITALNGGATRAQVLRNVIEITAFRNREFNRAFVMMQYYGYLRRDYDQAGYDFWLDAINNRDPNNYPAMVGSFITSVEYRLRFGQP
jgi:Tol biopolymer transport system component